jgi:glycerol-3-phosphate acyltransferase PlsY
VSSHPFGEIFTSLYLRQYVLGLYAVVLAVVAWTAWSLYVPSFRRATLVSIIAFADAAFLSAMYTKPIYLNHSDVFGTDAYLLISAYLWILCGLLTLISSLIMHRRRSLIKNRSQQANDNLKTS